MGLALAIGASENSFDMYKNQKEPIQSLHIGFTWYDISVVVKQWHIKEERSCEY